MTHPVEMTIRGLRGSRGSRSVSKFGLSVITVVFEDGVDIYFARQLVLERLIEAQERVPAGVEIAMGPRLDGHGGDLPVHPRRAGGRGVSGPVRHLTELRTVQDWVLAPMLKSIPGVNEVNSFGGYINEFQIVVDPDTLLKYGLSLAEVAEALRKNNRNVGGNVLQSDSQQYLVRGIGLLESVEDIRRIVLRAERGVPVLLQDVAEVREGEAVRQGASFKDGKEEVVGGIVMMLRGANSREVVKAIEARVAEINAGSILPAGLKIQPFYRRSDIVAKSVHTVTEALLVGSLLVVFVLFLFLRSFRGALIVILALPLSMLFTFIMMRLAGLSANLMSLGGLAISIGMIIDATIIQVENVQRHLGENGAAAGKLATIRRAVLEVRKPSIFGELIIALTFIPIIALQGIEGKMFLPLAFTYVIALFASLVLSLYGDPGVLPPPPQVREGKAQRRRRDGQESLPPRPRLGAEAQGRPPRRLPGPPRRDAGPRPPTGDGVHADHGRRGVRHGHAVHAGDHPPRVARNEPEARGTAHGLPRARDDRLPDRPDRHRPRGPRRREDGLRRHAQAEVGMDLGADRARS